MWKFPWFTRCPCPQGLGSLDQFGVFFWFPKPLFSHFLCPSQASYLSVCTHWSTFKCFIYHLGILIAIEYVCLFHLYPKSMRHLQQGRFSFKINSCLTLVIFLLIWQFVFPSLQALQPLQGTCCRRCPVTPVTLGNLQQLSELISV